MQLKHCYWRPLYIAVIKEYLKYRRLISRRIESACSRSRKRGIAGQLFVAVAKFLFELL